MKECLKGKLEAWEGALKSKLRVTKTNRLSLVKNLERLGRTGSFLEQVGEMV